MIKDEINKAIDILVSQGINVKSFVKTFLMVEVWDLSLKKKMHSSLELCIFIFYIFLYYNVFHDGYDVHDVFHHF